MALFETLEDRRLMTAAISDMTELAGHTMNTPKGTTFLYLNFDGGTINDTQAGGKVTIQSFQPEIGQNRQQAIQDILYRVSEIYAPFNVTVDVMSGAGQYAKSSGSSTIFIGDNTANVDGVGDNVMYSSTAASSCDTPTPVRGASHVVNSDAYDLGFVDPVSFDGHANDTNETDQQIAVDVAHESGHTFGLAHVLGNTTTDIMTYNGTMQFFSNTSLNLTDLNNNGKTTVDDPNVVPTNQSGTAIKTQNSYTYLSQVLGSRYKGGDTYYNGVADTKSVDKSYASQLAPTLSLHTNTTTGNTLNCGEYDVYNFNFSSTYAQTLTLNVHPSAAFTPQVFVFDSTGTSLVTSFTGASGSFKPANGTNYKIVIGSYNSASFGTYSIGFTSAIATAPIAAASVSTSAGTALFSTTAISQSSLQQLIA